MAMSVARTPVRDQGRTPRAGVLIVEDDEDIRDMMRLFLELEGYAVTTTANGRQALDLLETIPRPCLILLDLMMPVMDGWAFADCLGRNAALADIPVVIVSAFSDRVGDIKARAVFRKPVDMAALLSVVRELCGAVG